MKVSVLALLSLFASATEAVNLRPSRTLTRNIPKLHPGVRGLNQMMTEDVVIIGENASVRILKPKNMENMKGSSKKKPDGDGHLPLCVVDDRGYPIPEDSPDYDKGIVQYTTRLTAIDATSEASDILSTMAEVSFLIAAGGALFAAPTGGVALVVTVVALIAAAAFQIAAFFIGKTETDITQALIINQFAKTNAKIDLLSQSIEALYDQIRIDIGDAILDNLNNQLHRMASAYDDYVSAVTLNSTVIEDPDELKSIRIMYREKFRFACNELDFTPADIVAILYGHACGDKGNYPGRCEKADGIDTGICEHGVKQRSYLLDKFRASGNILRIREFKNWLVGAMVQALFLQQACLPPDLNICLSEDDPIFEQNKNTSVAALREVMDVLNATEVCTCPCKTITVKKVKAAVSDAQGSAEGWPYVKYATIKDVDTIIQSKRLGYFEDEGKTYNQVIDFSSPLTAYNVLRLEIEEEDDTSPNDKYRATFGPDKWYENTCDAYDKTLDWTTGDGPIQFDLTISKAATCPPKFCSGEKPDCPFDKYCDYEEFECTDQKDPGVACEDDYECLSHSCTGSPPNTECDTLLDFGDSCSESYECINRYCENNTIANEYQCCPENSACVTCSGPNDCGNCATCQNGYCEYDCDTFCGPTCNEPECATQCFPPL